jgi:hypothetical protein
MAGEAGLLQCPLETLCEVPWVYGLSISRAEDQVLVLVCRPKELLSFLLLFLVAAKVCDDVFGDGDLPAAGFGLWPFEDEFGFGLCVSPLLVTLTSCCST